jgi:hypothetical protein
MMAKGNEGGPRLAYTIFCDDVRLEVGNKLSLMGVFHQILVQHFPVTVMKFAVVTQWRGNGRHLFFNVEFPRPGRYRVQTLIDSSLADEQELTLLLVDPNGLPAPDEASEAVN